MTESTSTPPRMLPISFGSFLVSLYQSAMVHLGVAPDPMTDEKAPINVELARQTIDLLEILEKKTQGNLEADEKELLSQILYDLRLHFVAIRG